jgi:hypothetical protein
MGWNCNIIYWKGSNYKYVVFKNDSLEAQATGNVNNPGAWMHVYGHSLLYTLSYVEPSGNAPVRPGYNELTLQRATAACHVQVFKSYHTYNKHVCVVYVCQQAWMHVYIYGAFQNDEAHEMCGRSLKCLQKNLPR